MDLDIKENMHAKSLQLCQTLRSHGLWPIRLPYPWDSPGKNTGVSYHALLQGIFPTQGLNSCLPHLLHWQVNSLLLSPQGSCLQITTEDFNFYKAESYIQISRCFYNLGEGNGNPLQYSCLENPMGSGAW